MNYQSHYNRLIERARNRLALEGYVERHHVIPRCMGGANDLSNLVSLTAREHYLAHLLLAKLHPEVGGLWFAVQLMSSGLKEKWRNSDISEIGVARSRNRLYEWVKKRAVPFFSEGGHFANLGKIAITNGKRNRRIFPDDEIPKGWEIGYTMTFPKEGYISLTNGERCMRIPKGSVIPKGWHKGWRGNGKGGLDRYWANDGENDIRVPNGNPIPEGFVAGRLFKPNLGRICITNGVENRKIPPSEPIPAGWHFGVFIKNDSRVGSIRITDGVHNRNLKNGEPIPDGWHRGITRRK